MSCYLAHLGEGNQKIRSLKSHSQKKKVYKICCIWLRGYRLDASHQTFLLPFGKIDRTKFISIELHTEINVSSGCDKFVLEYGI